MKKIFLLILIGFILLSSSSLFAGYRKYSAIAYTHYSQSETTKVSGTAGVIVSNVNQRAELSFRLDQIKNKKTITKLVLYASNTDKISSSYVVRIAIVGANPKDGQIIFQSSMDVPVGLDSSAQKFVLDHDDLTLNFKKYDYLVVIALGDVNSLAVDEENTNNDPSNVPIVYGFKVVYE